MSLRDRILGKAAPGYSTETATCPESGEPAIGLRSEWSGGLASYHDTERQAVNESWRRDSLRREGDTRRAHGNA